MNFDLRLTRTRLRKLLRRGGCTDPRLHVEKSLERHLKQMLPCYLHKPPEWAEVAERQTWFLRVRGKRKRVTPRWAFFSGVTNSRTRTRKPKRLKFSPPIPNIFYRSSGGLVFEHDPEDYSKVDKKTEYPLFGIENTDGRWLAFGGSARPKKGKGHKLLRFCERCESTHARNELCKE